MKKIIVIGAGRSCSKKEINEASMKAIAAAGITIEDLHEFAKTMGRVFNSVESQSMAENFKKASEAMIEFNKELEKIEVKEKPNVNPFSRQYKRSRI